MEMEMEMEMGVALGMGMGMCMCWLPCSGACVFTKLNRNNARNCSTNIDVDD